MKTDKEMSDRFEDLKEERSILLEELKEIHILDSNTHNRIVQVIREINLQMNTITWCRN